MCVGVLKDLEQQKQRKEWVTNFTYLASERRISYRLTVEQIPGSLYIFMLRSGGAWE